MEDLRNLRNLRHETIHRWEGTRTREEDMEILEEATELLCRRPEEVECLRDRRWGDNKLRCLRHEEFS